MDECKIIKKLSTEKEISPEEKSILTCTKAGYKKHEKRYREFLLVLYKFVKLQKGEEVILNNISFPQMTFNSTLLNSKNIIFQSATFYGNVTFSSIDNVNFAICYSTFKSNVVFEDMHIKGNFSIDSNTFEKDTRFQDIKFCGEVDFSTICFASCVVFDNIEFKKKANFFEIIIPKRGVFKNIIGAKWINSDSLFCRLNIVFDNREKYIKLQKNSKIINLIRDMKMKFPNEIKEIEPHLDDSPFMGCYEYVDRLSDITLNAIENKEFSKVKKYLSFINYYWLNSDVNTKNILWDYYIENILYSNSTLNIEDYGLDKILDIWRKEEIGK